MNNLRKPNPPIGNIRWFKLNRYQSEKIMWAGNGYEARGPNLSPKATGPARAGSGEREWEKTSIVGRGRSESRSRR